MQDARCKMQEDETVKGRDGETAKRTEDRRQKPLSLFVISYPLFVRSVAMNCSDDFYDLNDSNDLNGLNNGLVEKNRCAS